MYIYTFTDAAKAAEPPELLANPTFTFMLGIDAFDLEEFMTFYARHSKNFWTEKKISHTTRLFMLVIKLLSTKNY